MLAAVVLEDEQRGPTMTHTPMRVALDTLAWVLEVKDAIAFTDNLLMLQNKMKESGYHLVKREGKEKPGNHNGMTNP